MGVFGQRQIPNSSDQYLKYGRKSKTVKENSKPKHAHYGDDIQKLGTSTSKGATRKYSVFALCTEKIGNINVKRM